MGKQQDILNGLLTRTDTMHQKQDILIGLLTCTETVLKRIEEKQTIEKDRDLEKKRKAESVPIGSVAIGQAKKMAKARKTAKNSTTTGAKRPKQVSFFSFVCS